MARICHVATAADWEAAQAAGSYTTSTRGRTLAEEGFLHASRPDQWEGVRDRYYADVTEPLVLLVVETDLLDVPVVEEPVPGGETYPHVYGPLDVRAVVEAIELEAPAPHADPAGWLPMRTLSVTAADGFRLAAQVSGRSHGPTLLLLAGQANSHRWWTGLREDFEDAFRVVSLDQRGTGDSRGEVTDWSTDLFADDARAVLAAVGAPSASVYGTSMGGRVAQILAASHPGVVDRLVLACTSPGGPHARERDADVRRALADPDLEHRRAALQRLFYSDAWPHPPERSHLYGDPTMSRDETRAHLRASARHDAWDRLPQIGAPTLVLHGKDDLMSPVANAHLLADRIRDVRLHLVEGGRHGFFEEHRTEVVRLIRRFLS